MIPYSRRWTTWCVVLGAIGVFASLAAPLPAPWQTTWRAKLLDLGHIPLFALFVLLLSRSGGLRPAFAVCIGIAMAGLGEAIQAMATDLGRSGDLGDWLRGAIGCLSFLLWEWSRPLAGSFRRFAALISGFAGLAAWPVIDAGPILADAAYAHAQMPVLADFTTPFELLRFAIRDTKATVDRGGEFDRGTARAAFLFSASSKDDYPGVDFFPPCGDWRRYRRLVIDWESCAKPLTLTIVVKDFRAAQGYGERFNLENINVGDGVSTLVIPLHQIAAGPARAPLDLSQIHVIQFFADRRHATLDGDIRLILHRIYLD